MPPWVDAGVEDYRRRLRGDCRLEIQAVEAEPRRKNTDPRRARRRESERLLRAASDAHRVALDGTGQPWRTEDLAQRLRQWRRLGRDVALLVGGADGHDPWLLEQCQERWSLGPLTLPHPLVRIIVAEQLYRAWSLDHGHPYHRA